jgi:hypothetical protein
VSTGGGPIHDIPENTDEAVAHLLELRVRVRHSREARALVDRCLALIARANGADSEELRALYREVDVLGDELALRFGAPKTAVLQ